MSDDIYSMTKSGFHEAIRQAKEEAWDEAYKTAMFDKEYYSHNPNPYRSQP